LSLLAKPLRASFRMGYAQCLRDLMDDPKFPNAWKVKLNAIDFPKMVDKATEQYEKAVLDQVRKKVS